MSDIECPCGSGELFSACCGRFISGDEVADIPERLMRSRYSAFVRADGDYLLSTWHESTRPPELHFNKGNQWFGLTVLETEAGTGDDIEAWVSFEARFKQCGRISSLKERSRFVKEEGRWYYIDGVVDETVPAKASEKIGRNEPCPCGSGKKYKRCCG